MQILSGIAKLNEECGEVIQIVGKLMAYPIEPHPSGTKLIKKLEEEIGDVLAAITYLLHNNSSIDAERIARRRDMKCRIFSEWKMAGIGVENDRDNRSGGAGGSVDGSQLHPASQDERPWPTGLAGQVDPAAHQSLLDRVQEEGQGAGEAAGRDDKDTTGDGV